MWGSMSVGHGLSRLANVQRRAVRSGLGMPSRSVHQRIRRQRRLRDEFRLPDGDLLLAPLRSSVQLLHLRLPVLQHLHPVHRLGVHGLQREHPLQRRPSVRCGELRRVHLEQPVPGQPGLR
jgi:hypothetical protein